MNHPIIKEILFKEESQKPKVSVLMPTYNTGEFLGEAIESILSQSFEDFEFIIVDDGSTDDSYRILAEYAKKDERIRIIKNDQNKGIVYSLNRGLRECRGEYVARMDADDIALKDRLEKQITAMEADPYTVVLGAALSYIDKSGNELGIVRRCSLDKSLIAQNPLLHPTVVFSRAILEQHRVMYLKKYGYAEDYFLWLQLSRLGKLDAIDDIVLKYRLSNSATRMRHLKGVLLATLRVKKDGVFSLRIRPTMGDALRFFLEGLLLFLPSRLVRYLYLKMMLKRDVKVIL